MKKADVKLIICLAAVGIISLAAVLFCTQNGKTVIITQDGVEVYNGSLSEDKMIDLETNLIEIQNGKVSVKEANCKNQICVNHKKIYKKGELISCIPNKILIVVE